MSWLRRLRDEEAGQVSVMVAVMMVGLVAVVGLVSDGGHLFAQKRDLQNIADAAALAGAMQIDEAAYRATGAVVLDEAGAREAAAAYLAGEGDLVYVVQASAWRVEVEVSRQASTGFLRVLGVTGFEISAVASAEPRHGVTGAE